MYFTSGKKHAFEQLMQEKPGHDHFNSGEPAEYEECVSCHYYRPYDSIQFCAYRECPYAPGRQTCRKSYILGKEGGSK